MAMTTTKKPLGMSRAGMFLIASAALLLSGCAADPSGLGNGTNVTVSDPTRMTRSGFLTDYARLKPTTWGEGIECWKESGLNASRYNKVLISRIVVSLAPSADKSTEQTIDPTDLKALTDYFQGGGFVPTPDYVAGNRLYPGGKAQLVREFNISTGLLNKAKFIGPAKIPELFAVHIFFGPWFRSP